MGNCVFKGLQNGVLEDMMVKVVTSNGGIMELYSPITVECITNEFPGHGIFRRYHNMISEPLSNSEELHGGQIYYLLPLNPTLLSSSSKRVPITETNNPNITPYRMSTCEKNTNPNPNNNKNTWWEPHEVLPRYNNTGVWKVKLVISPEKLSEILAQDSRTEALIESVRTVAKCGSGVAPSSMMTNSDQWSVCSSSCKGSTFGVDS
ncbi:hypothetical protein HN51_021183 [Arachis hypogaea]|uniref:uncharacterized protein n=1 Tax=Arachis hypogaea TaxID=3818 RepID=UPI000DEC19A9|nr:uncharacterized protein LOC112734410 [Arachis hypogaea]QHO52189.1 uncharacterized protein DS421_2g37410 [Arachis hypogaea]